MLEQSCGGVADAQQPFQGQGGQARLGLADQVNRQEPQSQRQLGAFEQRPGGQRGLVSAGFALEGRVRADPEHAGSRVAATRTHKALGPAGLLQLDLALGLSTKLVEKVGQRQARLKLDAIHGHGGVLSE